MKELVEAGAAVFVVSSELPEVLNLSNRLYVMHHGRMVAELTGDDTRPSRTCSRASSRTSSRDAQVTMSAPALLAGPPDGALARPAAASPRRDRFPALAAAPASSS